MTNAFSIPRNSVMSKPGKGCEQSFIRKDMQPGAIKIVRRAAIKDAGWLGKSRSMIDSQFDSRYKARED